MMYLGVRHMNNIYKKHSSGRSVGWSTWHFQWCTKYRYKIFTLDKYKNICKVFLQECSKRYTFELLDCEVDNNHVHALVSLPLTMKPVDALRYLKGFTSKCLFIQMPHLRKLYKRGNLWSSGKFIGSVGHITLEKAKNYIEEHHAKITLYFLLLESLPR